MKKIISIILMCTLVILAGCGNTNDMVEVVSREEVEDEFSAGTDEIYETETEIVSEKESEEKSEGSDWSMYANRVKVMCYNVFYQEVERRNENIQDLIIKNDPDVLMLQEVSIDWIPYLQKFMQEKGYSYYGYGRYGGELCDAELKNGEQFTPVLWKTEKYELMDSGHYWLSSTPDTFSAQWEDGTVSKFPRCVNWVILKDKETGGEFMALCIHTDPESEAVRTNSSIMTVEMVNEIRGTLPVVLAGDWNMSITDEPYLAVTENGYIDVRFVAEETTYSGSFNAWGERADDNYAFGDHIFLSDNMAAKSFEVVDDYYNGEHISDHNPLLTELYY